MLVEVGLEVGIILGYEELVVDVAEVVEGLVAAQTILAVVVVNGLTHRAPPRSLLFLLVPDTSLTFRVGALPRLLGEFSRH